MELPRDFEEALRGSGQTFLVPTGLPWSVQAFTLRGGRFGDVTVTASTGSGQVAVTTINKSVMWAIDPDDGSQLVPERIQYASLLEAAQGLLLDHGVSLGGEAWIPSTNVDLGDEPRVLSTQIADLEIFVAPREKHSTAVTGVVPSDFRLQLEPFQPTPS